MYLSPRLSSHPWLAQYVSPRLSSHPWLAQLQWGGGGVNKDPVDGSNTYIDILIYVSINPELHVIILILI